MVLEQLCVHPEKNKLVSYFLLYTKINSISKIYIKNK